MALNKNIIYNNVFERSVNWVDTHEKICSYPASESKNYFNYLCTAVKNDPKNLAQIEAQVLEGRKITRKDIETMDYSSLFKFLADKGERLMAGKRKREDLNEMAYKYVTE
jgi:hypothetical protein